MRVTFLFKAQVSSLLLGSLLIGCGSGTDRPDEASDTVRISDVAAAPAREGVAPLVAPRECSTTQWNQALSHAAQHHKCMEVTSCNVNGNYIIYSYAYHQGPWAPSDPCRDYY